MKRNLLSLSLLALFALFSVSCSRSAYPSFPSVQYTSPLIAPDAEGMLYNLQIEFVGKNTDGFMVIKTMENGEIRLIANTVYGLSLLDFGYRKGKWRHYYCFPAFSQQRVVEMLERDFELLVLPIPNSDKVKIKESNIEYKTGKMWSKLTLKALPYAQEIEINHPWIGLTISMQKADESLDPDQQ